MSRQAIAAALACEGLTGGERLVAFSLASYAGPDARAFPGTTVAAARAGLSRSRYLHDRDRLVRRGLVVIEQAASGRGHSSTVALAFATQGPWWEGEINAELFERVLSFTRARGPARLLLAAMAAVADRDGVVRGVSNDEVWRAAGLGERTYWRARPGLLESGELVLLEAARGRGNTNVWQVRALVELAAADGQRPSRRHVPPPDGVRPLLASVAPEGDRSAPVGEAGSEAAEGGRDAGGAEGEPCPVVTETGCEKSGQDRTVSRENCPVWTGVSEPKGGQDGTLFELPAPENPAETSAEKPAESPAANARAGKEPQNPRTRKPPHPPRGGATPAR